MLTSLGPVQSRVLWFVREKTTKNYWIAADIGIKSLNEYITFSSDLELTVAPLKTAESR